MAGSPERIRASSDVISRQVRQLEDLGLVETRTDPADGRARILVLTEEGTRRMRSVPAIEVPPNFITMRATRNLLLLASGVARC